MTIPTGEPSSGSQAEPLPRLIMVRAFEAVGRTGSMRKAAVDIHVSHTVVSRHVRNLEAWIGVKLVDAGPHGATLTREGERFYADVSRAFQLMARSVRELRPVRQKKSLRVWCMPGLATRWLAPRLSVIQDLLPGVEIVVRAIDRLPDFKHHEADVMITYASNTKSVTGEAILLTRPRMFPVVSPRWSAHQALPPSLEALSKSELIHEEDHEQWRSWFAAVGIKPSATLDGPRLWDANLGLDAAIAGQGIALASRLTATDEISAERLVELFETDVRLGAYYLLISPERKKDPAARKFQRWLRANMQQFEL